MFGTKKKFKKLIESDRYKNSGYVFEKVNGLYGIKCMSNNEYVDLTNGIYTWKYGSSYTKDCFGDMSDVINVFNFLKPIVEPINIEEVF